MTARRFMSLFFAGVVLGASLYLTPYVVAETGRLMHTAYSQVREVIRKQLTVGVDVSPDIQTMVDSLKQR